MKKEYEKDLLKKYPWLKKTATGTSMNLFGMECGDGWYYLLDDLCFELDRIFTGNPELLEGFYVAQIKEKFGGLRFYVSFGTDEMDAVIDRFEEKSFKVCEDCGKKGKLVKVKGWYRTQCPKCHKAWKIEENKRGGK
jgi:hypothetical protein